MLMRYSKFAKNFPPLFDVSKRIYRLIGNSDPIYECLKEFSRSKARVSFLQIGSNDGISQDPLREFIVRYSHWEGCFVEPLPHLFKKLKQNYRYLRRQNLRYENVAASDHPSEFCLFRIKDEYHAEFPSFVDQIASAHRSHITSVFPNHPQIDQKIETVYVEARPVAEIAASFRENGLDLLHLDVEGHEAAILKTFPFSVFGPEIILFETGHLSHEDTRDIDSLLRDKGYVIYDVGIDTIARKEQTRCCNELTRRK